MGRPSKHSMKVGEITSFTCLCCGTLRPESKFYKNKWSKIWVQNDHLIPICRDCVQNYFNSMKEETKSNGLAMKVLCGIMDWPFYASMFAGVLEKHRNDFSPGFYFRNVQMAQYNGKTHIDSFLDGELTKNDDAIREERETRWTNKDKQNMRYAISIVGYDPFDLAGMTDEDRRYCFNVLAGYCDSEGIRDDSHKRQAAIQATQLSLQCKKIDDVINEELMKRKADEGRLRSLSETKTKFISSLSKIAQDNNFSSNYNDNSRAGKNTLSLKMKEMEEDGYQAIKQNLFDIKTCEAMKQIAELSDQSILDQLTLDSNEYAGMVKDQRQMITSLTERAEAAEEENRMLKNKIIDLENAKKRK